MILSGSCNSPREFILEVREAFIFDLLFFLKS